MTAEELNEELQNFDYPPYIPKNEIVLFESIANDALIIRAKPTIFTASANDSISYNFATFTSYVSKGYYLYKLT